MSYSRRMVGLKRWVMPLPYAAKDDWFNRLGGLLDLVGSRNCETCNHLPQLLAGGDVGNSDFAELLEIEQGQALWKQFAVDDALTEAGDDPEADAPGKLVHRRADSLQIVRFDVLQAVSQHHP